jgi:hypothetical protein
MSIVGRVDPPRPRAFLFARDHVIQGCHCAARKHLSTLVCSQPLPFDGLVRNIAPPQQRTRDLASINPAQRYLPVLAHLLVCRPLVVLVSGTLDQSTGFYSPSTAGERPRVLGRCFVSKAACCPNYSVLWPVMWPECARAPLLPSCTTSSSITARNKRVKAALPPEAWVGGNPVG